MKDESLQRCQVETPHDVVDMVWLLARKARRNRRFGSVLDLGAGDARFANAPDAFDRYVGIEKDLTKVSQASIPANAQLVCADGMLWFESGYDLSIGNPPYIRHHDLDPSWRDRTIAQIEKESGVSLKKTANVFILFLMQALLRTHKKGLVVQLVPFEWVTRPSASELRDFIEDEGWSVKVYRFKSDIFPRVLTTASITIIDKRSKNGLWSFGEIGLDGAINAIAKPSGSSKAVLAYSDRNSRIHALRGLSPGSQEIFILTEEERLRFSLRRRRDVVPCVTSLRKVASKQLELSASFFETAFVRSGARCWLIRSDREKRSNELTQYLASVGKRWKQFSTCVRRKDWSQYAPHPAPSLLISSGFTGKSPKVLVNGVGAVAVGSVYAIFSSLSTDPFEVAGRLRSYDFEKRVVHHSNNLKKIEVRQLNSVLNRLFG